MSVLQRSERQSITNLSALLRNIFRKKKVFHSSSLWQFRIMKIQHGDVKDRKIWALNAFKLCFTLENSVFLHLSKLLLSSYFSAPLVDITFFPLLFLLYLIPLQSYSTYCTVSRRSKIFISISIIHILCWKRDKVVNSLWLIS